MESHFVLNPVATNMLRTDVVIERLCRTCLLEQEESHPLFENNVDQILMYCTSIQISKYDGFPSKICNSCLLKAQQAYDFKQQVENSEVTLKQYFCLYQKEEQPLKEVKEEVIELDTGFNSVIIKNELILQDVKDEIQETPYVSEIELKQEHREGTQSNTIHFKCTKCIKYFSNEEDLELHNLSHIRKRFICHICNNSYKHKSTLKSHVLIHAMSDKVHACTECDKRYALSSQLIIHMRTHTGEKPFLCSICGKGYIKPEYLARHTKIHTGIQKKWECDICHKRFIDFYKLRVHKMVHTGEKPFVCSVCGHLSRTSALLKSHMKIHTKEKPYHCSMCPKTFSNRSGLTVHQVTHSGERNHICKICGKGISSAFYLKRHLRIHTGERPYSCTEPNCDLKFTSNIGLKTHVRKHKGIFHSEKPHCCTICLKMFGRSGQLKEHMNSHTGMKPHVCSICGKKFAHSRSLYRHKKEHKLIEN